MALTYWRDRLERLSNSMSDFFRNTFLLPENYFEGLPSRSPEAYAIAYDKYRCEVSAVCERDDAEELDESLDSIKLNFPVQFGFRSMNTEKDGVVLGEEFAFQELASFLYTELYKGMTAGNVPRRCRNCRHFFLALGGYDTVYCNRIAPGKQNAPAVR